MLVELGVRNLGVIEELTIVLGPGMTALTGETGAGKTLLVEAIELLVGGRADAARVRAGAAEAAVEGRFVTSGEREVVLRRVVPAGGRSRAYIDGQMAPVAALAEAGAALVDLHGQHAHQSLLSPAVQRAALDRFAGVDSAALDAARAHRRDLDTALAALGGDSRARARELDLLRFQIAELDAAHVDDADEDASLEAIEDGLADAAAHRDAGAAAYDALHGEGGACDHIGAALAALARRAPYADVGERLQSVLAEAVEAARDVRDLAENLADDPERLAEVRARRQLLRGLRRKYGETLIDVIAFGHQARARLVELESHDARSAQLEAQRADAERMVAQAAADLGAARRGAAEGLARAVERQLRGLALPEAAFAVTVGEADPGDDVVFGLGANRGEPVLPLAKVASGGELARAMLAARLVLSGALAEGPATLVFDEVDAGIGGEAAVAVGRALAALADAVVPNGAVAPERRQVLVVTHLAQVAAFADAQIAVTKHSAGGRTVATATALGRDERIVELSRMLSGRPTSPSGRRHAAELLDAAVGARS